MKENQNIFRKLLRIEDLYILYCDVGQNVITYFDILNYHYEKKSKENSVQLLISLHIIGYNDVDKTYFKKMNCYSTDDFVDLVKERISEVYSDELILIIKGNIKYDEVKQMYYTNRNYISLDFSGLLMLLEGMNVIKSQGNTMIFLDKEFLYTYLQEGKNTIKKTNIEELKKLLAIRDELGQDAEDKALEYEKSILKNMKILGSPEHVSMIDVGAGYDIASYLTSESTYHDKFIEVKSCSDDTFNFFISRNEIETAKK